MFRLHGISMAHTGASNQFKEFNKEDGRDGELHQIQGASDTRGHFEEGGSGISIKD